MDESAELRELYRRLQPPPLADDLAEADAETARVVRWMQGAWRELEPPRAAVPLFEQRGRRGRRLVRPALLAAAAIVLLLAGAALWRALERRVERLSPVQIAEGPSPAKPDGIEIVDVRPDQIELRSGPVRLVLLGPPSSPPDDSPGS